MQYFGMAETGGKMIVTMRFTCPICNHPSATIIALSKEVNQVRSPLTGKDITECIIDLKIICANCGTELNVKGEEEFVSRWVNINQALKGGRL